MNLPKVAAAVRDKIQDEECGKGKAYQAHEGDKYICHSFSTCSLVHTSRVSRNCIGSASISGYTRAMNKKTIGFFAVLGMTVGSVVPMLFGDYNSFDAWSVLGGLVGGIVCIMLGVWAGKRFGD